MSTIPQLLRVLADPTRLRILALLDGEELAVGELARVLAMSQSRISNHLKVLREAGLLAERREASFVLVRLGAEDGFTADLWASIRSRIDELEERADDEARLREVLDERRHRSRQFFDRVASEWDVLGSDFRSGHLRLEAMNRLIPRGLTVADVGCGTGYMSRAILRRIDRVICVDNSNAMLDQARRSLIEAGDRVELRRGELDALPLKDGEVDAVFANMVMHHVPDLHAALREMHRALVPGGMVVLTDLMPHRETWMTDEMADLRLGLDPTDLARRLRRVGFTEVETETPDDAYLVKGPDGQPRELNTFLLAGRKAVGEPDRLNGSSRSDS